MKKLNFHYLISTVTLVFMLFLFYQTLQINHWFADRGLSEQIRMKFSGKYSLVFSDSSGDRMLGVEISDRPGEAEELIISIDTIPLFMLVLHDFEEEQVLVEPFQRDSSGEYQRLDGCEILLGEENTEKFTGGTIGDFCGLKPGHEEYLVLELVLAKSEISLQIESRQLDDHELIKRSEYLLERLSP